MSEIIDKSQLDESGLTPTRNLVPTSDSWIVWLTDYAFKSPGLNIDLNKALLAFQSGLTAITKDMKNEFANYTYASLDAIMSDILPRLTQAGLVLTQAIGREQITTTVTHVTTGQFFGALTPIIVEPSRPKMGPAQLYGTGATYARRYALGLLGITTCMDDDASGETTEKIKREVKTIDKATADQLVAEIMALGYDAAYLNTAVEKAIGKGKTVFDIPQDRLEGVKKWISMQKSKKVEATDEEVV